MKSCGSKDQPQDEDTRPRDRVTGERIGPRTHLLSAFNDHYQRGRPPGAVIAERIIVVPAIPHWPETSPGGTAYVIPIQGLPAEDAERPWELQYGNHLSAEGRNKTKSAILGNRKVTIRKSNCSGILHCQHLAPRLLEPSIYTNIDAYWGELESVRMRMTQGRQEAISWAWTIRKDYDEKKACAKEGSREDRWVACNNAPGGGRSRRSDTHQKQSIPAKFDAFLSVIKEILTSQEFECLDDCHVVDQIRRKAKTCEFVHDLSGPGKMVKVECPAYLKSLWEYPENTEVRKQFQHSANYDDLLESHGAETVDEVAPHLVNHGYFTHPIRKSNAIQRPRGSSREGGWHEWRTQHQGPDRFTQGMEYGSFGCATSLGGSIDTDYSDFFIAHAKIFIFADCYGVAKLLDLALQKLHGALCGFRLSRNRMNDILALVRFCYERPGPEKLKRLVASYSAAIIDVRGENFVAECFRNLM
ncbi:hypothetical protein E4U40_008035 [Claviceps sp. LM458 group G5]|nr:hypothetical protein E4U40_008035 [Claviceps sp. LM458 group G5]